MADWTTKTFIVGFAVVVNALFIVAFNTLAETGAISTAELGAMQSALGMVTLFIFAFAINTVLDAVAGEYSREGTGVARILAVGVVAYFAGLAWWMTHSGPVPSGYFADILEIALICGLWASLPAVFRTPEGSQLVSWIESRWGASEDAV